mgnify:CR=1 FL=1
MIIINPKDKNILKEVAKLHIENLKTGFISKLGVNFLTCFYKTISLDNNCFLAVYIDENNIITGFVSGTISISKFNNIFKKKCFFIIIFSLLKQIFNIKIINRFIETYNYSLSKKLKDFPESELISIAVDQNYRTKGIAKILYRSLIEFFKEKNVNIFKIMVGSNLIEANKFYEKMGAKKILELEIHKGSKSYLYLHNIG